MSVSYKEVKLLFDYVRDIIDKNRVLDLSNSQTTIKIHEIENKFDEVVSLALEGNKTKIDEIIKEIIRDIFSLGKSILDKSTQNTIPIVETLLDDLPIDRKRTYEHEIKEIKHKASLILDNEQLLLDISVLKNQINDLEQILNELKQIKDSVIKERRFNIIGSFKNAVFLIIGGILSFLISILLDDFLLFILILIGLISSYYLYQYHKRSNKKWFSCLPSLFTILIVGILKYPDYYPMIEDQLKAIAFEKGIDAFVLIISVVAISSSLITLFSGDLTSIFVERKVRKNLAFSNIDTKLVKHQTNLISEPKEFNETSLLLTCMLPIINVTFQLDGVGVSFEKVTPYRINYIPKNGINLKLYYSIPEDVPQTLKGKRKLILKMSGYLIGEIPQIDFFNLFRKEEVRFNLEFNLSHLL